MVAINGSPPAMRARENSLDSVLLVIMFAGFALCAVSFVTEYHRWERAILLDRSRETIVRGLQKKRLSLP
jgi:hypothetical protein